MPEFILDTCGQVEPPPPAEPIRWRDLDSFTQGYIEALFFTSTETGTVSDPEDVDTYATLWNPETDSSLPGDVSFADLAPKALAGIIADCARFQEVAGELLELAYERDYDEAQAGRDFWYTRTGAGVGYWDRQQLEPDSPEWTASRIPLDQWTPKMRADVDRLRAESLGQRLSDLCGHGTEFPTVDPYMGDDGKVWLS